MTRILAIETSCDETAIAIVDCELINDHQANFKVINQQLYSQVEKHQEFGGVYPNLAKREHKQNIIPLLEKAFQNLDTAFLHSAEYSNEVIADKVITKTKKEYLDRDPELADQLIQFAVKYSKQSRLIDAVAVTAGPGLAPALWVGVNVARSLATLWQKSIIAVNHMVGHVHSALYPNQVFDENNLILLVSGGHTEIVTADSSIDFSKLGHTLDDAVGEAFDKVGRLLGLDYPAGPIISKITSEHRQNKPNYEHRYHLPIPMQDSNDMNFSFSGLKSAVKRVINELDLTDEIIAEICREFEEVAIESLVIKLEKAIKEYYPKQILAGGGVSANQYLKQELQKLSNKYNFDLKISPIKLTGDNAVMIAMAGFWNLRHNITHKPDDIAAMANWPINKRFSEVISN